ncbi:hypothetical protein KA005_03215, partial [bacterium]|nr:hypothetical protein [bacterium]
MKIIAPYECKMSGGNDRLFIHLVKNWPEKGDIWKIVCWAKNSSLPLFHRELEGHASITTFTAGTGIDILCCSIKSKGGIFVIIARILRRLCFPIICLKNLLFFSRLFRLKKPNVVYLQQGGYPGSFAEHMAGIAAKITDRTIKVVTSIQNLPYMSESKFFSKVIDGVTNYYTDSFIFASKHTVSVYAKKTALRKQSMNVVNEGVMVNPHARRFKNDNGTVAIGMI